MYARAVLDNRGRILYKLRRRCVLSCQRSGRLFRMLRWNLPGYYGFCELHHVHWRILFAEFRGVSVGELC